MKHLLVRIIKKIYHAENRYEPKQKPGEEPFGEHTLFRNVCYGTEYPNSFLDIYKSRKGDKAPLLLFIHGGGFTWGSKEEGDPNAGKKHTDKDWFLKSFLEAGYDVAAFEYALAPEYKYPTPILQLQQAVMFLQEHADEFALDMERILLNGGSAGGNIAGQYAAIQTNPDYAREMGMEQILAPGAIRCVLFNSALIDPTRYDVTHSGWFDYVLKKCGYAYYNEPVMENAAGARQSDILPQVTKDYPPSFISDANTGSFYDQARDLYFTLLNKGVEAELHIYPKEEASLFHGFESGNDRFGQENMKKMLAFAMRILEKPSDDVKKKIIKGTLQYQDLINADWTPEQIKKQAEFVSCRDYLFIRGFLGRVLEKAKMRRFSGMWTVEDICASFNYMRQLVHEGHPIFHTVYDAAEAEKNPELKEQVIFHFPVREKTKIAVITAGGGYAMVCSFAEGFPIAKRMNELGYHAFVVNYRTGKGAAAPNPQDDLARAVSWIWQHAQELNIDPEDYLLGGFSAGGHLAASFGTKNVGYQHYNLPKPGGMFLAYPVVTMGEKAHAGSRNLLLGKNSVAQSVVKKYSIECNITEDYPPTFLWQCDKDREVAVENSRMLDAELTRHGVKHIYKTFDSDAHGWGSAEGKAAEGWFDEAVSFWKENIGQTI